MKFGIFGGSFDPIGTHHTDIAQAVLKNTDVDQVWMMPCFKHKFDKKPSDSRNRLEMARLATEELDSVEANNFEIEIEHNGSTWETIQLLEDIYNDDEFFIIIGTDNADVIHKWANHTQLISNCKFIVAGEKSDSPQWYNIGNHQHVEFTPSGRSTNIRNAVEKDDWEYVEANTHPKVAEFIKAKQLYRG